MKSTIKFACLFGAVALVSQSALASGLKIRGGATQNAYSLDVTRSTGSSYNYATSRYKGNAFGLTWLMDDANTTYLDLAVADGTGLWDGKYTSGTAFTSDLKRSDGSIVLGSSTENASGSVGNYYVGWKSGITNLAAASGATANPSLDFKINGFVFGGGVGIPLGPVGALGLSLGMGAMSGQYDSTTLGVTTAKKADMALGYSYGIVYTLPFTKNFGISADYKANVYKYTFDSGMTTEWSLNEKFSAAGVSLYASF